MKKYFIILALQFVVCSAIGQNDPKFSGKWKVVSVLTIDFYINFKTDSCFFSEAFRKRFTNDIDEQKIIAETKSVYGWQTEFGTNNIFRQYLDTTLAHEGTYKVISSENVLVIFDNDTSERIKYFFKNNNLHLLFKGEEDMDFELERQ